MGTSRFGLFSRRLDHPLQWLAVFLAVILLASPSPGSARTSVRTGELVLVRAAPAATQAYQDGVDFTLVFNSSSGMVEAPATAVDLALGLGNASSSGCQAADFSGFPAGNVALVQRGSCNFVDKVQNAANAGAVAVVLFNQGNAADRVGLADVDLGNEYAGNLPVFFATYGRGVEWAGTPGLRLRLESRVFRGSEEDAYLEYCLAWPAHCSLSAKHLGAGWERHQNPERLQVTASTYKTLMLVAYAEAVVAGRLDPERRISRDEWARFSVRRDGGALANVWNRLGQPSTISLDEMMRGMMRESDNAAPDWLLNELGTAAVDGVVRRYVRGYHDVPISINASFVGFDGNPLEPGSGPRLLSSYSGFGAFGYRRELSQMFNGYLQDPDFARQVRQQVCTPLPWEAFASCGSGFTNNSAQWKALLGGFFSQTNSRSMMRLMEGILEGNLLSPAVAAVVRRHLEYRMEEPAVAATYSRYGAKGGSFSPQNVCNWIAYAQDAATGAKVVVATYIKDSLHACGSGIRPNFFVEKLATDPAFAARVRDRMAVVAPRPELLARVSDLTYRRRIGGLEVVTGTMEVRNIGLVDALSFRVSAELGPAAGQGAAFVRQDIPLPRLRAGQSTLLMFTLSATAPPGDKFFSVDVDSLEQVAEGDEDNNLVIEKVR